MNQIKTILFAACALAFMAGSAGAENVAARVDWAQRLEMALEQSGKIEHIAARAGDRVKVGAELLRLDPTPFASELIQAEARLEKAQAELKDLEGEFARAKELYDRGVLATVPLQRTELAVTRARSELASARAALKLAQYRLAGSRLVAPFDAWVIRYDAVAGQVVNSTFQPPVLIVIGRAGAYIARAMVDAATAARIDTGASLTVRLGAKTYPATVKSVALEPDEESRYAIEAEFNTPARQQIGASAELELP